MDDVEALANAVAGLIISALAVYFLRASGAWITASAETIALIFFVLSWARSRMLRAIFRRADKWN